MMSRSNLCLLVLVLIGNLACKSIVLLDDSRLEQQITNLLTCEECVDTDIELELLTQNKAKAYRYLENIINSGAPAQIRAYTYYNYLSLSRNLSTWGDENNLQVRNISPADLVKKVDFIFKTRAIYVLTKLGGNRAINILEKSRKNGKNVTSILEEIDAALLRLNTLPNNGISGTPQLNSSPLFQNNE